MNNIGNNNQSNNSNFKRNVIDDSFEQNAKVIIHKGKEHYGGGSGFYAIRSKATCPNVNDGGHCNSESMEQSGNNK